MFDRLRLHKFRWVVGILLLVGVVVLAATYTQSREKTSVARRHSDNPPSTSTDVASSAVICPGLGHGDDAVPINLEHIFCGELNRKNRFTGFHSRPGGKNPATIAKVQVMPGSENANGIYEATVFWNMNRASDAQPVNASKFSTMFPDACSKRQIIASILYASRHPVSACPAGAPGWTTCGLNRPAVNDRVDAAKDKQYCLGSAPASRFMIAFASHNGRINTAFPLMTGE